MEELLCVAPIRADRSLTFSKPGCHSAGLLNSYMVRTISKRESSELFLIPS